LRGLHPDGAMSILARSGSRVLDATGVAVWIAAMLWVGLTASRSGTDATAVHGLLVTTAACFMAGWIIARLGRRWMVPAVITAALGLLLIISPEQMLSGRPLSGPFGYSNATGALFAQGAAAALILATSVRWRPVVFVALIAAASFAIVPLVIGSIMATLAAIALIGIAVAARNKRSAGALVLLCAGLAAATLVATVVVGTAYTPEEPGRLDRLVTSTLGERRPALWHDAWRIMLSNPVEGVGVGNFAEASPVARSDRDARWAHNEFLEGGAEAGIPGFVLAALIFGWALAKLWTSERQEAATAVAAGAVAALAMHACVDYVLHFPAIPAVSAALVGSATGAALSPSRTESH
jgi:O-antigen ligase